MAFHYMKTRQNKTRQDNTRQKNVSGLGHEENKKCPV